MGSGAVCDFQHGHVLFGALCRSYTILVGIRALNGYWGVMGLQLCSSRTAPLGDVGAPLAGRPYT